MMICIFDAWDPLDLALVNSHWVASQTSLALIREGHAVEILEQDAVDPDRVLEALCQDYGGFAYFGHGRGHLLYRQKDPFEQPIPLVGGDQARLIGERWFHAFACLSGRELSKAAAAAGVAAYLGYREVVVVEWEVDRLPDEARALLAELVTTATLLLARGERSRDTLRRGVRDISNRVIEWASNHADPLFPWQELWGIQEIAVRLHRDLVFEGATVLP